MSRRRSDDLVTYEQARAILGIATTQGVRDLVARGRLTIAVPRGPGVRQTLVSRRAVENLLKSKPPAGAMLVDEVARVLGLNTRTVYKLDHLLAPKRVGSRGTRVYDRASVLAVAVERGRRRVGYTSCPHVTKGRELRAASCSRCVLGDDVINRIGGTAPIEAEHGEAIGSRTHGTGGHVGGGVVSRAAAGWR